MADNLPLMIYANGSGAHYMAYTYAKWGISLSLG